MRVQIALDTARGLEYIHEHAKPHYVHRDVKTSNILLDSAFKAKISDFGLAKLVGKINDDEASVTRVVGTYGYLAPETIKMLELFSTRRFSFIKQPLIGVQSSCKNIHKYVYSTLHGLS